MWALGLKCVCVKVFMTCSKYISNFTLVFQGILECVLCSQNSASNRNTMQSITFVTISNQLRRNKPARHKSQWRCSIFFAYKLRTIERLSRSLVVWCILNNSLSQQAGIKSTFDMGGEKLHNNTMKVIVYVEFWSNPTKQDKKAYDHNHMSITHDITHYGLGWQISWHNLQMRIIHS